MSRIIIAVFSCMLVTSCAYASSPCDGISHSLTKQQKEELAPIIAKQLQKKIADIQIVHILESFRVSGWSIIYVSPDAAEDAYLFYRQDPRTHNYVDLWGGVARKNEERGIYQWALHNERGIPKALAACFAWYVTKYPNS